MLNLGALVNRKISWHDRRMLLQLAGFENPANGVRISKKIFWTKKLWEEEDPFKISTYDLATAEDFAFCRQIGIPSMISFFEGKKVVYLDDLQTG